MQRPCLGQDRVLESPVECGEGNEVDGSTEGHGCDVRRFTVGLLTPAPAHRTVTLLVRSHPRLQS